MAFVPSKDEADVRARMGRERRRGAQKAVFDARQRLTSSSGTRASFDFELLDEYATARIAGTLVVPIVLIILATFASLWVPIWGVAAWAALAIAANTGVILVCRRFRAVSATGRFNATQWTASFIAVETIYGVSWALLSLFSLAGDEQMFAEFASESRDS